MKNMDPLNENIVQYLQASQDPFVTHIWKDGELPQPTPPKYDLIPISNGPNPLTQAPPYGGNLTKPPWFEGGEEVARLVTSAP